MPYNGSGTFNRIYSWVADAAASIKIRADRMDTDTDDIASGLSNCITKDGQTTISANIPFNTKKITGLGDGTALTDAATVKQVQNSTVAFAGTSGGAANAQTLTMTPSVTALVNGQRFRFKAGFSNTTAATLAVDATGALALKTNTGSALVGGEVVAGSFYDVTYNSADTSWWITSAAAAASINNAEASVASAATTNIGSTGVTNILITGTTPITSLGSSASTSNPLYSVRFSASLTLTYNPTSLILPTSASIVTAAGDSMLALYLGSGNWRVLEYTRFTGVPLIAPGTSGNVLTSNGTTWTSASAPGSGLTPVSGSPSTPVTASVTFSGITGGNDLVIMINGVSPSVTARCLAIKPAIGGVTGGTNVNGIYTQAATVTAYASKISVIPAGNSDFDMAAADTLNVELTIYNYASTTGYKHFTGYAISSAGTSPANAVFEGTIATNSAIDGLLFEWTSAASEAGQAATNFDAGTINVATRV